MHIDAHLDIDLVAVEQADQITVLLELLAPEGPAAGERPPAAVQVVLDRSGSMDVGERLPAARSALKALVDRLDPRDAFGLVAFDDQVEIAVPAGPVADKPAIHAAIDALYARGSTNLSAGLLRGVQEARRSAGGGGATLLLVSDGMANEGVVEPERLEAVAVTAQRAGVTVSTIGVGLGYDETVLAAVARGGQGNHVFAEDADSAAGAVAGEVDGLLSKAVQAASLLIRPTSDVQSVVLFNDLPAQAVDGGIMVELGDLWAGEQRTLLLGLGVPAIATLGLAQVASLELRYVALPDLSEQTVTLPVSVNVVPGDEAAGRAPDPKVRTELLFQQAQEAKRRAADAIARGDEGVALQMLADAGESLAGVDDAERGVLLDLAADITAGGAPRAAKRSRMDHHRKSRKRGRGD
ncbi:MAG: Ca-activated chloride channel [Solirubrobacteraceae bacterium]|jgi:Ca-activated chloride channel family protein|nr:Ca-activated chloride channel [Solirubrobacteraceae bacterium]